MPFIYLFSIKVFESLFYLNFIFIFHKLLFLDFYLNYYIILRIIFSIINKVKVYYYHINYSNFLLIYTNNKKAGIVLYCSSFLRIIYVFCHVFYSYIIKHNKREVVITMNNFCGLPHFLFHNIVLNFKHRKKDSTFAISFSKIISLIYTYYYFRGVYFIFSINHYIFYNKFL